MMTREEILAVYDEGPDAVVRLVQSLLTHFEAQVQALNERVRELEIRLGKDSHNSHKPPSSDEPTFRRPARKSLRKRSGKKPGGQPGHLGCTRLQVEEPDEVHLHAPDSCARCGDDLRDVASCRSQQRQVFDLPPLRLHVHEHQVHDKRCPGCGAHHPGSIPAGRGRAGAVRPRRAGARHLPASLPAASVRQGSRTDRRPLRADALAGHAGPCAGAGA